MLGMWVLTFIFFFFFCLNLTHEQKFSFSDNFFAELIKAQSYEAADSEAPHTPKLNHHLIRSIHIQLTGSVFVRRSSTLDPDCDHVWCGGGMRAEERKYEKCVCVSLCVTVWRCCNRTVTRLLSLGLECSYPDTARLTVTHMLNVGAGE